MKPVNLEIDGLPATVYAKDQPEYFPLPCVRLPNGQIAIRWQLDDLERDLIADSGTFYLCVNTFNRPLQPLLPMADCPEVATDENGNTFFYSPAEYRREQGIAEPEIQIDGLPAGYRDRLTTVTEIHFGFWDKVKILFGWKVELRSQTFVQHCAGKCYCEEDVSVYRPRKLPKGWGAVEVKARDVNEQ
ncbi:MAG: hypothetical protein HY231_24205 [Acidobacteria bacterium]|nr:hypothetical protein [Acidobacteriota bacterium]